MGISGIFFGMVMISTKRWRSFGSRTEVIIILMGRGLGTRDTHHRRKNDGRNRESSSTRRLTIQPKMSETINHRKEERNREKNMGIR
jgi:hypothetical protein